jgi:hypothetical protein
MTRPTADLLHYRRRLLTDYELDMDQHVIRRRRQPDEPLVLRLPPRPVGMRPLRLRWWLLLAAVAGALAVGVAL